MATSWLRGSGRRAQSLIALAAVTALSLTACSNGGSAASNAPTPGGTQKPTGELNIIVSSATGSDAGFQAVTKAFNEKYPDVKVNFTAIPNENYNAAKSSRLSAGSADIVVALPVEVPSYVPASNEGDDARLADAGGYLDLTNEPFMKNFNQSILKQSAYKGKNLSVPTGLSYYSGMFYNKKIFSDNGLTPPKTWDDFVKICETLKGKGITPLGIGGKDSAGVNMLGVVQAEYPTAQDKQDLAKGLYAHSIKLNEGKQLDVMKKLATIYSYAQPNFAGENYQSMTAGFVGGKYAMMGDGTWSTASLAKAGGDSFKFGYFPIPSGADASANTSLGGKVELSLAVPANAKNKTAAIAWLDTFSSKDGYKLFLDQAGFAPSVDGVQAGAFYQEIATNTANFEPAWDTIWIPNQTAGPAAKRPFNWEGMAPMGSLDPQGAADAAEKDWEAAGK